MGTNVTDYLALCRAKKRTDDKFEEMLKKLNTSKERIDQMNEESWQGDSAQVFNSTFEEMQAKIKKERNEYNTAINEKLKTWSESFSEAEKKAVQRALNME